ncbi:hypothetical protein Ais01nite_18840 [Asanoa ishikariensis]|uniref:Radical SAM core domain-containing protein n=1 Tax=Asanoa ishikariensis TaxID=137265 RepID=A0A1H3UDK7_9ACTN|nr:FxsB family cyclophane-forming radical SAM/SPASM peptide maturase [Asanoa ishikariensis]GIF63849.1 hypothetical protein Ais01nite_18840 [Asanoa ishikariensis]SDZ60121.1 uncharacterized protein SAMN05421684_6990 [Asanoa ishikariensis]
MTVPVQWPTDSWMASVRAARIWQPYPFQQFILKLHGWCNLSCDYCYIYEMADRSWRDRPRGMSTATVEQTARRIGEHAAAHDLGAVNIVLHGGEPLLAGPDGIAHAVDAIRHATPAGVDLTFRMQTNGTLLTDRVLDRLLDLDVMVSISLDGNRSGNRHRRDASGRESYDAVVRGIERLRQDRYRRLFSHLLCTIDLENPPVETYETLLSFEPPLVDFLLPHGTWDAPPPGRTADPAATPYADWLIAVFDRWYGAPRQETRIRFLNSMLYLLLGGHGQVETIGLEPRALVVVDTDGSIQQVDTLKATFPGAPETGLDVFRHTFDDALNHPMTVSRQVGMSALCDTCQRCAVRDVCGAGYFPHRYRAGSGFLNPSVYCPDLFTLITHINDRVTTDLRDLVERPA